MGQGTAAQMSPKDTTTHRTWQKIGWVLAYDSALFNHELPHENKDYVRIYFALEEAIVPPFYFILIKNAFGSFFYLAAIK